MQEHTKILIIRHGQTTYNHDHKLDGQEDTELTPLGEEQAKKLSEYLKRYPISNIYSSPLKRAIKTADIIKKRIDTPQTIIIPEFKEIDCGDCTGLTKEEIKIKFPDLVKEWQKNTDPPFPKGESLKDVEKRAIPKFRDIIKDNKNKTILIAGHGSLNIAILGYFLEIPFGLRWKIKQNNCCINEINIINGKLEINKINFH